MRAAIYTRVSTDEQVQKGNSLPEQNDRLRAYCKAMGYDEVDLYEDNGYSAKDMNRPKLKLLLDNIESYDLVVTTKIDRLCRNLLDLLTIVEMLSMNNCGYASASESFDTSTPAGRMVLQILGAFAEFERERIRERVRDNMRSMVKKSSRVVSRPCFGFDIEDGHFILNEYEADYVRKMADWLIQGMGCLKVAKRLNAEGVRTKEGNTFSEGAVRRLMQRETITGSFVYNRSYMHKGKQLIRPESEWIVIDNHHPAIIDKDVFREVRLAMDGRKYSRKHADNDRWLLSGLVRCGHCEGKMSGQYRNAHNKEHFKYICTSYQKKGECFRHVIDRGDIEPGIINYILTTEEFDFGDALPTQTDVTLGPDVTSIKEQLKKCSTKLQKQLELYEEGDLSKEDFILARDRVENERAKLSKKLEELTAVSDAVMNTRMKSRVNELEGELRSEDRLVVKNAIRQLVKEIKVTDGSQIEVTFML